MVIGRFLEGGYRAVLGLVLDNGESFKNASFVLGLPEELHTREAVDVVAQICKHMLESPERIKRYGAECASAFNLLLSFKPILKVSADQGRFIRNFLHARLKSPLTEAERATTMCALRGVGNMESIELIHQCPPLTGPWSGTETNVAKVIKRRLRE